MVVINSKKDECAVVKSEYDKSEELLNNAYSLNIIPKQFRNIYAIYYLYDFITTSDTSLSTALLHCDLNEIKQKLDTVIKQQQKIIINQAVMVAQNQTIIKQNTEKLHKLASIEQNTERAAQYSQIAANNAEACAWIGIANYIDK